MLVGEFRNAFAHRRRVGRQRQLTLALILGIDVAHIGGKRSFGVDDQMASLGQIDHRIGPSPTMLGRETDLAPVVLAGAQAGAFQHVFEHQLAPVALYLLLPLQRLGQTLGLIGDLAIERLQMAQLGTQPGPLLGFMTMNRLHFFAKALHLRLNRLQQAVDTLLRKLGEGPPLALKDLVGQIFELLAQLFTAVTQQPQLRLEVLLLLLQRGSQTRLAQPHLVQLAVQRFKPTLALGQMLIELTNPGSVPLLLAKSTPVRHQARQAPGNDKGQ